jgi:hypothetical protein
MSCSVVAHPQAHDGADDREQKLQNNGLERTASRQHDQPTLSRTRAVSRYPERVARRRRMSAAPEQALPPGLSLGVIRQLGTTTFRVEFGLESTDFLSLLG